MRELPGITESIPCLGLCWCWLYFVVVVVFVYVSWFYPRKMYEAIETDFLFVKSNLQCIFVFSSSESGKLNSL